MRKQLLGVVSLVGVIVGLATAASAVAGAPIVVGIDSGGGPWVSVFDQYGSQPTSPFYGGFLAYFDFTQGGLHVAIGDVNGDGKPEVATAPARGGRGEIRFFDAAGKQAAPPVLASSGGCGTPLALGDVTGDGRADVAAGQDDCGYPNVQLFDGATGKRLSFFAAYDQSVQRDGVQLAAGDLNGDGRAELVAASPAGPGGLVNVLSGVPTQFFPAPLRSFAPFGDSSVGALQAAVGDLNGDGRADLVVGGETASGAQVRAYDGPTGRLLTTFTAYPSVSPGSLRVAAGDLGGDGKAEIVTTADTPLGTLVEEFAGDGTPLGSFAGPGPRSSLAVGDLNGDGKAELVFGDGSSYEPRVTVLSAAGTLESSFAPYGTSFVNGVRVATGDVTADPGNEYVTGQGPGGTSEVDVFDSSASLVRALHPFAGAASDGVYVAAGDVNGDGRSELVVGADAGGEPRVKVLDASGKELASFLAFDPSFRGGVRVAAGDLDGDGKAEIVAGSGPGGPPRVRVFSAAGRLEASFLAFDPSQAGGVYVAVGDLTGDGRGEIVTGAGSGAPSDVRVFDATGRALALVHAYSAPLEGGVRVAVGDVDGDGRGEIVTGPGRVAPVEVRVFGLDGRLEHSFLANDGFQGGIFVAVPGTLGAALSTTAYPLRLREGVAKPVLPASFLDPSGAPADSFAATVRWGDGASSLATIRAVQGQYLVTASKRYRTAGTYGVVVTVADTLGRRVLVRTTASVADAPIAVSPRTLRAPRGVARGTIAVISDANRFARAGDFRARVGWERGRPVAAAVVRVGPGRFAVVGSHRYRAAGRYPVAVDVRDLGGSRARARATVLVGAPG